MLVRLETSNFRNLADFDLSLGPGTHLFLGPNGAGKSSVLEAVYFLATTRSFRARQISDCVRHGADGLKVEGEVDHEFRSTLTTGLLGEKKIRAVNHKATSLSDHLSVLPVISWATGDSEILTGMPVLRRRLLDRGVLGMKPSSLAVLERFRRALNQKREILLRTGSTATDELLAWNGVLAGIIRELAELRNQFLLKLRSHLDSVLTELDLSIPRIDITYRPSPASALEGEKEIFTSLERIADREIRRGAPLIGSQRDELEIRWGGREIRSVASAGERKALGLAILAAQGRVLSAAGREPLVLLDDADAELATPTLGAVWRTFAAASQVFATSSRPQAWLTLSVNHVWQVKKGAISPL